MQDWATGDAVSAAISVPLGEPLQIESNIPIPVEPKRKRGRPPGSKNKVRMLPNAGSFPVGVVEAPGVCLPNDDGEHHGSTSFIKNSPKRRGRPPGSKNKSKLPTPVPDLNTREIESHVTESLRKRGRPKKEPTYTIIGTLNEQAAIEWEEKPATKEDIAKFNEQMIEVNFWREKCKCAHSRTAHKTDGRGKCMICECKEYHDA